MSPMPRNGSADATTESRYAKALHRRCYGCDATLAARYSVDYLDERARRMGRQLFCLTCVSALRATKGEAGVWGRLVMFQCEVCAHPFARYRLLGYSRRASLNGTRMPPPSTVCSAACAARRRRATRRPILLAPCQACGHSFERRRRDARFCSVRCRVRAHRRGRAAI
jgi:hypothetical protein